MVIQQVFWFSNNVDFLPLFKALLLEVLWTITLGEDTKLGTVAVSVTGREKNYPRQ